MDIRSVLVKFVFQKSKSGSSGIMLNNGHILTTSTTIAPYLDNYRKIAKKEINQPTEINHKLNIGNLPFFIYYKDEEDGPVRTKRAFLVNCFFSEEIYQSTKKIFRQLGTKSPQKNDSLMSLFIILRIERSVTVLEKDVSLWFENLPKTALRKGQQLRCNSAALGDKDFLDHYSIGIVSNYIGKNHSLILSDMPLTPGGEGSPVYCDSLCSYPVGIVVSATKWRENEWISFSVIADLRQVLQEFLKLGESITIDYKRCVKNENSELLDVIESSIFQICTFLGWGTAILIDKERGILITNAHVVNGSFNNVIHTKEGPIHCDIIYSTPDKSPDIAILKTRKPLGDSYKSIKFSKNKLECADVVYAAGFPNFNKNANMGPTVTEGCISHIHPHMINTTCSVYPGSSGGAILDRMGGLVAVIAGNLGLKKPKLTYFPKFNMNIPISMVQQILENYLKTEDVKYLKKISEINVVGWNIFSKL